jgi:hypothetical protein
MDEAFAEIQALVERGQRRHETGAGEIASRLYELQQRRQQLTAIEE